MDKLEKIWNNSHLSRLAYQTSYYITSTNVHMCVNLKARLSALNFLNFKFQTSIQKGLSNQEICA